MPNLVILFGKYYIKQTMLKTMANIETKNVAKTDNVWHNSAKL